MVVRTRKKITRQRGSRTHGWGLVHRGSGNRGGVGNAGTGKKADCKMPSIWKEDYFGKEGFIRHGKHAEIKAISIKQIEQNLQQWCNSQLATKQNDTFMIDLTKAGFTKLLSTGKATKKINLTVTTATQKAIEKIKSAGGSVTLPQ